MKFTLATGYDFANAEALRETIPPASAAAAVPVKNFRRFMATSKKCWMKIDFGPYQPIKEKPAAHLRAAVRWLSELPSQIVGDVAAAPTFPESSFTSASAIQIADCAYCRQCW